MQFKTKNGYVYRASLENIELAEIGIMPKGNRLIDSDGKFRDIHGGDFYCAENLEETEYLFKLAKNTANAELLLINYVNNRVYTATFVFGSPWGIHDYSTSFMRVFSDFFKDVFLDEGKPVVIRKAESKLDHVQFEVYNYFGPGTHSSETTDKSVSLLDYVKELESKKP